MTRSRDSIETKQTPRNEHITVSKPSTRGQSEIVGLTGTILAHTFAAADVLATTLVTYRSHAFSMPSAV